MVLTEEEEENFFGSIIVVKIMHVWRARNVCFWLTWNKGMDMMSMQQLSIAIGQEGNPKGAQVFGVIAQELRQLNFIKMVSFAPEVL